MNKLSRRDFVKGAAAGSLALVNGCTHLSHTGPQSKRPNVLLIIDDQHNLRHMGWTGECEVQTPHIDQLASESVCFTSGYDSNPVCAPARHSIYSGLYSSEHGVVWNEMPLRDGIPTMIAHLNKAGYTTANIGKMHNAPPHHRRDFQYVLHHEFLDLAAGGSHYGVFLEHELKKRGLKAERTWMKPRPGFRGFMVDPLCNAGVHWAPEDLTSE